MNLTSKRMLPFLTVCAGVCALSASAEIKYVADNFEAAPGTGYTNAYDGMTASIYKMATEGGQELYTNLAWHATAGDASTIVTGATPFTATSRPLTGDTTAQYLKLETEGQTLSRYVNFVATNTVGGFVQTGPSNISFKTVPVYVDTLIQFTPSEDAPDITDSNIKLALFVNASSNLVLRHKYFKDPSYEITNSVFESLGVINPQEWYRLTIRMVYNTGAGATLCLLWLNGQPLTHYNGEIDDSNLHNGPKFWALTQNAELNEVSFQGTGAVDELVVTDTMPTFEPPTGLTLTLAFNEALLDVTVDSANVTNGQSIASGATLNIAAIDWYQIASVSGEGITYNGTNGVQVKNSTGVITADGADRTATIVATNYTGTIPTSLGGAYATVPADKLSAWAIKSGLTEAEVIAGGAAYLDNYLLNIDESVNATISIKSIVVDSVAEKATITVEASTTAVNFQGLNGQLVVATSEDLTSWGELSYTIKSTTDTVVTIEVPYASGNFIKARVE